MASFRLGLLLLTLAGQPLCFADATDRLERFFAGVATFEADFSQVILDENLIALEESAGHLWLTRPGRFRWDYGDPLEQSIIADGKQLWVYDVTLEQVTVRDQQAALGNTPAELLAGEGDFTDSYQIEDLGKQGSLEWISLTPRAANSQFSRIHLGFESGVLKLIQMLDTLEQVTRVRLENAVENRPLPDEVFLFKPPPGVDVITDSG